MAEDLVEFAAQAAALLERARARLVLFSGRGATSQPNSGGEYLTAEQVAGILNADPPWVYRHRRQLGGDKLEGLVRFSRRRLDAYLARQHRIDA